MIGLPGDRGTRRNIIADKIVNILQLYLKSSIIFNQSGDKKEPNDEMLYENVAGACIEYLVLADR